MPRQLMAGERATMQLARVWHSLKVETKDSDGTWRDVSALAAGDFLQGGTFGAGSRDQAVAAGQVRLRRRRSTTESLSPLVTTSTLNRNAAAAFAPLIDLGRELRASCAAMVPGLAPLAADVALAGTVSCAAGAATFSVSQAGVVVVGRYVYLNGAGYQVTAFNGTTTATLAGAPTFAASAAVLKSEWREIFYGRIDEVNFDDDPIVIDCSSLDAWLQDTQIEIDAVQYGGPAVQAEGVLQSIVTAWPSGKLTAGQSTVSTPVSPAFIVTSYAQGRQKVLEACRSIAQQVAGWDFRFRYNAADVYVPTFMDPQRARATIDDSFGPGEYHEAPVLGLSMGDVRNAGKVWYVDANGATQSVTSTDAASVSKYGRRYYEFTASAAVKTATQAQALADAVNSDLSTPPLSHSISTLLHYGVQLYDRHTLLANTEQYDTNQALAVVNVQHEFPDGSATAFTHIDYAGKVIGAYADWQKSITPTKSSTPVVLDLLAAFPTNASTELTARGDASVGSWRFATSTVAMPTLATVRAAGVVAGQNVKTTLAQAVAVGQRVYIIALAYSGSVGAGQESLACTLEVVRDGTGYGAPPSCTLAEAGVKTRVTASLSITGAAGQGAVATGLTSQYMIDGDTTAASWVTPSATALPRAISIPRANWAAKTVTARVTQADGQSHEDSYVVDARFDALDTGTGAIVRAWPHDDGFYSPRATDTSGNAIASSVGDSRGAALNGMFRYNTDGLAGVLDGGGYRRTVTAEADQIGHGSQNLAPAALATNTPFSTFSPQQMTLASLGLSAGDPVSISVLASAVNAADAGTGGIIIGYYNGATYLGENDALLPLTNTATEQFTQTTGIIPAGTTLIQLSFTSTRANGLSLRRVMLTRGPKALGFNDTPFRLNRENAGHVPAGAFVSGILDSRSRPINTGFQYGTDGAAGVVEATGQKFIDGAFLDGSRRPTSILDGPNGVTRTGQQINDAYQRAVGAISSYTGQLQSAANDSRGAVLNAHFRYATDGAAGVLESGTQSFIHQSYVDASRRPNALVRDALPVTADTLGAGIGVDSLNMLVNGGGQTGALGAQAPGWGIQTAPAMVPSTANPKIGDRALRIDLTATNNSLHDQPVTLVAGEIYEFGGWISSVGTSSAGGGVFGFACIRVTGSAVGDFTEISRRGSVFSGYNTTQNASTGYNAAGGGVGGYDYYYLRVQCNVSGLYHFYAGVLGAVLTGMFDIDGAFLRRVDSSQVGAFRATSALDTNGRLSASHRLGQLGVAGVRAKQDSLPLSSSGFTITIAAHTLYVGGISISYPSGSVTAVNLGKWYVYMDDPGYNGGGSYGCTATPSNLATSDTRYYVGVITVTSGTGSGAGGGGGSALT